MTSWTTPRTWITGEVLSSSNFNTHIRDNLIFYGGTDAISTTPPASPGNGQRWVYPVDAANGVYWTFIYSTATSTWIFSGGLPLHVEPATGSFSPGGTTTYVDLAGTSLTVPRAGTYHIQYGCTYMAISAGATGYLGLRQGATATTDATGANPENQANDHDAFGRRQTLAGVAASTQFALQWRYNGGAGAIVFYWPFLSITPAFVT